METKGSAWSFSFDLSMSIWKYVTIYKNKKKVNSINGARNKLTSILVDHGKKVSKKKAQLHGIDVNAVDSEWWLWFSTILLNHRPSKRNTAMEITEYSTAFWLSIRIRCYNSLTIALKDENDLQLFLNKYIRGLANAAVWLYFFFLLVVLDEYLWNIICSVK